MNMRSRVPAVRSCTSTIGAEQKAQEVDQEGGRGDGVGRYIEAGWHGVEEQLQEVDDHQRGQQRQGQQRAVMRQLAQQPAGHGQGMGHAASLLFDQLQGSGPLFPVCPAPRRRR